MTSTGATPLRNDQCLRSLSTNEQLFLRSCLAVSKKSSSRSSSTKANNTSINNQIIRQDGRQINESRPLVIQFSRSHAKSEATVKLGRGTRVISTVSCEIITPPNPTDRPNDGQIQFFIDLNPMSNMGFEANQSSSGSNNNTDSALAGEEPQRLLANRIQRILERTFLTGGAIDTEALCVQSGEWVWKLMVDVIVLDHCGNVLDAAGLAVSAALRHFRLPCTTLFDNKIQVIHSDDREPTPLPIHHTPYLVSFALFHGDSTANGRQQQNQQNMDNFFGNNNSVVVPVMDPDDREEMVADCQSLTFSFNKHSEMCCLDFTGGCEIQAHQLIRLAKIAEKKTIEFCDMLEKALTNADEKAKLDRMERIRGDTNKKGDDDKEKKQDIAFHEKSRPENMEIDQKDIDKSKNDGKEISDFTLEEEKYRVQALDFANLHLAAKVKEDHTVYDTQSHHEKKKNTSSGNSGASKLLKSMLENATLNTNIAPKRNAPIPPPDFLLEASIPVGLPPPVSMGRSEKADSEFMDYVAKNMKKQNQSDNISIKKYDDSDDEEEEVTVLHSEFGGVTPIVQNEDKNVIKKVEEIEESDEDITDLTMAVIGKKKKKRKFGAQKKKKGT